MLSSQKMPDSKAGWDSTVGGTAQLGYVTDAGSFSPFLSLLPHLQIQGATLSCSISQKKKKSGGVGGVQRRAGGVIQYVCALHYGKERGWEKRLERAEIYQLCSGCRGAKIALFMAAVVAVVDAKLQQDIQDESRLTQFREELCVFRSREKLQNQARSGHKGVSVLI